MRQLPGKIKPTKGFSHALHIGLKGLLPILAYILVRTDFVGPAILLVVLSKWRMFAVRPRYWMANLLANGIDIIVAVSLVLFMANTTIKWWQVVWAVAYAAWLVWLKPRYDVLSVSVQAMVGQLLGLIILYLKFGDTSIAVLVVATWAITYLSARHFLTSFDEAHSALLSHVWGYFAASLAFILGHWLLFYGTIAQIIVILTTVGYSLGALYYLEASGRLASNVQRQFLGLMFAILAIILVLSDWTGSTVG